MSTVDKDPEEFVRKLEPFGELARDTYFQEAAGCVVEPWELVHPAVKLNWSRVADAVLTEYDPEWPSVRAGL